MELSGPEKDALKKKKAKTTTDKDKEKISEATGVKGDKTEEKKPAPAPGRGARPPKKGDKESFTPGDLLEDRFVSEIKTERIKEGAMVIADTNYYIEGVLRKFIKIKSGLSPEIINDDELAEIIASKSEESDAADDDEDAEVLPPEGEDDGDEEDGFSILIPGRR